MRVISKETDFFDYVSKVYDPAGESPTVYDRNKCQKSEDSGIAALKDSFKDEFFKDRLLFIEILNRHHKQNDRYFTLEAFVVVNELYWFVTEHKTDMFSNHVRVKDYMFDEIFEREDWVQKYWYRDFKKLHEPIADLERFFDYSKFEDPVAFLIFRAVFHIRCCDVLELHAAPILKDTVLTTVIDSNQLYQNLSMAVAEIHNVEKNYVASNKERILAKGFDLKTSFRGKQK